MGELQTYCLNLLGSNTTSLSFVNGLISKRNEERRQQEKQQKQKESKRANRRNKKDKNKNNDAQSMRLNPDDGPSIALQKKYDSLKQKTSTKSSKNKKYTSTHHQGGSMTINYAPISKKSQNKSKKKQRKRKMCGCQATLHDVFKNCTECGNILCMLEGEGPCFYCSAFVTLAGTISNNNKSDADAINSDIYRKAVAQKDKLLRFGREKIAQTTIIDDQGDFYENEANNLWLSQRERDIAKQKAEEEEKKLNESRADKPIEINIAFGANNQVQIVEAADERKAYTFSSIDRDKQLKEKLAKNKRDAVSNEANKVANSWYHNSSLTGHASKVYASLQKMINSEKEQIKNANNNQSKKEQNKCEKDAVDSIKSQFIKEANSDEEEEEKAVAFLSKKSQSKNMRK